MEIGFITSVVSVRQEAGVSPAGIVFAVVILILLYRAWRKEDTLSDRQDAFYRMVMEDISEIRKAHEHCEQQIQHLSATNIILDRWKARCEDVCPNSDDVHARINGAHINDH